MKKMKFISGMCVAGMLVLGGMAGCGSNETKSTANQQESQKERDMKEADKAAMDYVRAGIDVDIAKLNDLQYEKYDFGEGSIPHPGASKEMKERYDLYRYDLKEGKAEYYYHVVYYHPIQKAQKSEDLKMVRDEKDGKWKNYEWAWGTVNSLESTVGSMKPTHVHKWGQKE
ncbi:hypothetical protein BK741_17810 [Bacillus thuringiensis serovar iberica]|uniref:Lipoprotein n=1 Tax=Bacillus thuringiensis serovar iberica TaxID=180866 RepID=A0A9X6QNF1_BACTU|nr:hypothetical protein [Bacillus thuringiensis]MEB9624022.1 hypothetical protein [Bacillus cereus]OUB47096.1 hypothetical protein BK741_17810 [Bacillus thuringiensis serovar iberica]